MSHFQTWENFSMHYWNSLKNCHAMQKSWTQYIFLLMMNLQNSFMIQLYIRNNILSIHLGVLLLLISYSMLSSLKSGFIPWTNKLTWTSNIRLPWVSSFTQTRFMKFLDLLRKIATKQKRPKMILNKAAMIHSVITLMGNCTTTTKLTNRCQDLPKIILLWQLLSDLFISRQH